MSWIEDIKSCNETLKKSYFHHAEGYISRLTMLPKIKNIVEIGEASNRACADCCEFLEYAVKIVNEIDYIIESRNLTTSTKQHKKTTESIIKNTFGEMNNFKMFKVNTQNEYKKCKMNSSPYLLSEEYYNQTYDHYVDSVFNYIGENGIDKPLAPNGVEAFGYELYGKSIGKLNVSGSHSWTPLEMGRKAFEAINNLKIFSVIQSKKIKNMEHTINTHIDIINNQQEQLKQQQEQIKQQQEQIKQQEEKINQILYVTHHQSAEIENLMKCMKMTQTELHDIKDINKPSIWEEVCDDSPKKHNQPKKRFMSKMFR